MEEARRDAGVSEPKPIFFKSPQEFYDWLEEHHETDSEVYVGFFKQHTGKRAMSWSEAVDQALCFGWIDTRTNSIDEDRYMQRFTPRRPGSNWSKINVEKVAKLTEAGLMRPAGLAAFEKRTDDKTGVYSYEDAANGLPPEYDKRLRANTRRRRVLRFAAAVVPEDRHLPGHGREARGDSAAPPRAADRGLGRGPRHQAAAPMSRFEDPCIITCSISGAVANREQCPAIPYTPEEYAAEAKRAVDEGCSMIHIHARTPDGVPSYEVEDFRAITEAIRGAVDDVIINYSTGAIGIPIQKRIEYLRELRPDVAALNMGSMNYAKYSSKRKDFVFKTVFENSFDTIIEFVTVMNELGIRPEHECFDSGHVANLDPLIDMGLVSEPLQVSCVMGVTGGIRPTAKNLAHMAEQVPDVRSNWGVIGISRDQWRLIAAAVALGGNVRAGLEDNFYLPDGEMARSNGELIAKAREIVENAGRRAATVAEARELLGV